MTIIFTIAALAPVIPKIEMSFVSQFVNRHSSRFLSVAGS